MIDSLRCLVFLVLAAVWACPANPDFFCEVALAVVYPAPAGPVAPAAPFGLARESLAFVGKASAPAASVVDRVRPAQLLRLHSGEWIGVTKVVVAQTLATRIVRIREPLLRIVALKALAIRVVKIQALLARIVALQTLATLLVKIQALLARIVALLVLATRVVLTTRLSGNLGKPAVWRSLGSGPGLGSGFGSGAGSGRSKV